jgi:hypothetical protein
MAANPVADLGPPLMQCDCAAQELSCRIVEVLLTAGNLLVILGL